MALAVVSVIAADYPKISHHAVLKFYWPTFTWFVANQYSEELLLRINEFLLNRAGILSLIFETCWQASKKVQLIKFASQRWNG